MQNQIDKGNNAKHRYDNNAKLHVCCKAVLNTGHAKLFNNKKFVAKQMQK